LMDSLLLYPDRRNADERRRSACLSADSVLGEHFKTQRTKRATSFEPSKLSSGETALAFVRSDFLLHVGQDR
jgi:hypothetical protein